MRGRRKDAAAVSDGGRATADGCLLLYPADRQAMPHWWRVADGQIVARHRGAQRPDWVENAAPITMLLPPSLAVVRHVTLRESVMAAGSGKKPLSDAQLRAVALHQAMADGVESAGAMHAVVAGESASPVTVDDATDSEVRESGGFHNPGIEVAVIARADMDHILRWARDVGVEPTQIVPVATLLPEPEQGMIRVPFGDGAVVRGQGMVAQADEPWLSAIIGDAPVVDWSAQQAEQGLMSSLAGPVVNLRSGAFALRQSSGADVNWAKRVMLWAGLALLLTLLAPLVLTAKYHISAAKMDAKTLELARPYAPHAADATQAVAEIDRLVAAQGGAYAFTGPLAGLMQAMRPVPGVSISSLSLREDGLLHATLASAQADEINRVLAAVQGAGYRITATSSTDPGGRVIAEITVKP